MYLYGGIRARSFFRFSFPGSHPAGTQVRLLDASGSPLLTYTSLKSFRSVVISDPSIVKGNSYTIETGEEITAVEMEETTYGTSQGMGGFHGGFNRNKTFFSFIFCTVCQAKIHMTESE